MYKVLITFKDDQDKDRVYFAGESYPAEGYKPTKTRIDYLAGSKNKLGKPVIERVAKAEPEKEASEE